MWLAREQRAAAGRALRVHFGFVDFQRLTFTTTHTHPLFSTSSLPKGKSKQKRHYISYNKSLILPVIANLVLPFSLPNLVPIIIYIQGVKIQPLAFPSRGPSSFLLCSSFSQPLPPFPYTFFAYSTRFKSRLLFFLFVDLSRITQVINKSNTLHTRTDKNPKNCISPYYSPNNLSFSALSTCYIQR